MNVELRIIKRNELKTAWLMQKKGFLDIFLKYFDRNSPVLRTYKKFCNIFDCVDMYWIIYDNDVVGEIWVAYKNGVGYLANIFILKPYRNKGIAQKAIKKSESLYPHFKIWRLDTIKLEKGNCHLYEKLGYVPTGSEKKINKRMTIIDYEKRLT